MDYFENLKRIVEDERDREKDLCLKEIRETDSEEREKEGITVQGLEHNFYGFDTLEKVLFEFYTKERIRTKIRKGDSVLVSFGDLSKKNPVGKVVELENNKLVVMFDNFFRFPKNKRIRVDKYIDKNKFDRQLEILKEIERKDSKLKRILLGQIKPSENEISIKDVKSGFSLVEEIGNKSSDKVLICTELEEDLEEVMKELGKDKIRYLDFASLSKELDKIKEYAEIREEKEILFKDIRDVKKLLIPFEKWYKGLSIVQIMKQSKSNTGIRGIPAGKIKEMSGLIKERTILQKKWSSLLLEEEKIIKKFLERDNIFVMTNIESGSKMISHLVFDLLIVLDYEKSTEQSLWIPINKSKKVTLVGNTKKEDLPFKEILESKG